MTDSRPTGNFTSTFFKLFACASLISIQSSTSPNERRAFANRMAERRSQATSGLGILVRLDLRERSLHHDFAAVHSRARAEIDDVIGAAHRFFVVLDDDE